MCFDLIGIELWRKLKKKAKKNIHVISTIIKCLGTFKFRTFDSLKNFNFYNLITGKVEAKIQINWFKSKTPRID